MSMTVTVWQTFGDSHGYVLTNNPNEADILLMNTCSIREKHKRKYLVN